MRISDWSSDVCSSDLLTGPLFDTTTLQPLPAPTFGPEKAKTAEIGVKATLFDRRLRLNIAGFHTDYRNIQLTFVNGSSPVTANGGNGKIDGFEVEMNAALVRRTEERRVGKEGVSTCRSRRSPYH